MGVTDVEQAKRRLEDILTRARHFEIPSNEVISMRASQKLLARTKNAIAWTVIVGAFVLVLSVAVYARWPTQEVETVRTVLIRRTCSGAASGEFSERVAALLHSSSTQDDC